MKTIIIVVDESGTLPDVKDKVIVVAAVGTKTPDAIERVLKSAHKKGRLRKQTGELKFYTAGDKTKLLFFQKIAEENIDIFVLIVEKMGRKIPDTPQHFAILCWLLLTDVFNFYSDIKEVVFDRHFSRVYDTERFNQILSRLLPSIPTMKHVDSKKYKKVNIADMVAGATLANETNKKLA